MAMKYLNDILRTLVSVQVMNIRKLLNKIEKPHGLYPNFLSPVSGNWVQRKCSYGFYKICSIDKNMCLVFLESCEVRGGEEEIRL